MLIHDISNSIIKQLRFALLPKNAIILDIGSGSNPLWRANLLLERELFDDSQRPGKLIINDPLICGDIQDIPLTDNSIDFVHCSHILEHVEYPEKAINEIMRVGKKGYIEVPSELCEKLLYEFPYHLWYINIKRNKLFFIEKNGSIRKPFLHGEFKDKFKRREIRVDKRFLKISIFWEKYIEFEVHRVKDNNCNINETTSLCLNDINIQTLNLDLNNLPESLSIFNKVWIIIKYKILKRILGKKNIDYTKILACPFCKRKLEKIANNNIEFIKITRDLNSSLSIAYMCKICNLGYFNWKGIPLLQKKYSYSLSNVLS